MRLNWFFNVLFSIQRHLRCSYRISNAIILLLPSDLLHGVFLTWLRRQQKNEWRGAGFFFFLSCHTSPISVTTAMLGMCTSVYKGNTLDRPASLSPPSLYVCYSKWPTKTLSRWLFKHLVKNVCLLQRYIFVPPPLFDLNHCRWAGPSASFSFSIFYSTLVSILYASAGSNTTVVSEW